MFNQKQFVLDFLKAQIHAVVATTDPETNKPSAATVAFSETDELELIFGTFDDTKKFTNIVANPNVALSVNLDEICVQYEGVARVTDWEEEEDARNTHLEKHPSSQEYAFHEKQRFIKVTPKWIRYTDLGSTPQVVFEITF